MTHLDPDAVLPPLRSHRLRHSPHVSLQVLSVHRNVQVLELRHVAETVVHRKGLSPHFYCSKVQNSFRIYLFFIYGYVQVLELLKRRFTTRRAYPFMETLRVFIPSEFRLRWFFLQHTQMKISCNQVFINDHQSLPINPVVDSEIIGCQGSSCLDLGHLQIL